MIKIKIAIYLLVEILGQKGHVKFTLVPNKYLLQFLGFDFYTMTLFLLFVNRTTHIMLFHFRIKERHSQEAQLLLPF